MLSVCIPFGIKSIPVTKKMPRVVIKPLHWLITFEVPPASGVFNSTSEFEFEKFNQEVLEKRFVIFTRKRMDPDITLIETLMKILSSWRPYMFHHIFIKTRNMFNSLHRNRYMYQMKSNVFPLIDKKSFFSVSILS